MKVLIVDDHPLIRSGVTAMLAHHERHIVVREARQLGEALGMLGEENETPDLILLDLNLPDSTGLRTLATIREAAPHTPVVVLSADDSKGTILGSLDCGAQGFIPKTMDPELIWAALGIVLAGGIYLPREALGDSGGYPIRRLLRRRFTIDQREPFCRSFASLIAKSTLCACWSRAIQTR
jgi:DNA-binding NarL/FixJ family response regulator